jgi:hypothetical protein
MSANRFTTPSVNTNLKADEAESATPCLVIVVSPNCSIAG